MVTKQNHSFDRGIDWLEEIGAEMYFGGVMNCQIFPTFMSEGVTVRDYFNALDEINDPIEYKMQRQFF